MVLDLYKKQAVRRVRQKIILFPELRQAPRNTAALISSNGRFHAGRTILDNLRLLYFLENLLNQQVQPSNNVPPKRETGA
jgi:hypothetical protein